RFRQSRELGRELLLDRLEQALGVGDEHRGRVRPVLGFVQQISRQQPDVGAVVSDDQALRWPAEHLRMTAKQLALDLRRLDRRATGAYDLAHLWERFRAERERRDPGRAIGAEHLADPELAGDPQ